MPDRPDPTWPDPTRADPSRPDIETLSSREVFASPWLRLREDRVRFSGGAEGAYGVVEKPDYAIVAALENGVLHLVEQYRYPLGARSWELPMGTAPDSAADMAPEDLARMELREETGVTAEHVERIGRINPAGGVLAQTGFLYVATGLTAGEPSRETTEQDMIARAFPVAEVLRMAKDGEITDGPTLASLLLLSLHGRL